MFNFGHNNKMPKRPDIEPNFSAKTGPDKYIVIVTVVALIIVAALVGLAIWLFFNL